jgi:hypothetical protein
MGVHEAWRCIEPGGVYNGGGGPNAVLCSIAIYTKIGDSSTGNCDVNIRQQLTGGHTDKRSMAYYYIGRLLAAGDFYKSAVTFPKGLLAKFVDHAYSFANLGVCAFCKQ